MSVNPINPNRMNIEYVDFELDEETSTKLTELNDRCQQSHVQRHEIFNRINHRLNQNQKTTNPKEWQNYLNRHKWTIGGLIAGLSIAFTITKIARSITPCGLVLNIAIIGATTLIGRRFDMMNQ